MTSYTIRAVFAALLMGIPSLPVAADPPAAGQPVANSATFRAKQVLGMKMMIQNNSAIGTVDDIVFDNAGNLEYLIVSTSDNKLITVPWDAAKWDIEKKTGTLNITQDVYKTIPTYTPTTYPQFYTPTYRTEIYRTYGLVPRALRRIEGRLP